MDGLGETNLKNFSMDIEGPNESKDYTVYNFEGQDYKNKQKGS